MIVIPRGQNAVVRALESKDETIKRMVELIDALRHPFKNSSRGDLYWLATNALNEFKETGHLSPLNLIKTDGMGKPKEVQP